MKTAFHLFVLPLCLGLAAPVFHAAQTQLSREAVRGHEWHIMRHKRTLPPKHDTVLPFNRFLVGHGDHTPTVFNPGELRGYTWARELAQALVFTSTFLCYADRPDSYLRNQVVEVIKAIPSVWDETVVLPGSKYGSVAAFARRSGKQLFIGVINASDPAKLALPLAFLGGVTYRVDQWGNASRRDDAWAHQSTKATSNNILRLSVRKGGGFVARIVPVPGSTDSPKQAM